MLVTEITHHGEDRPRMPEEWISNINAQGEILADALAALPSMFQKVYEKTAAT